ncbi:uracil phosphoribosyltransferase [Tardisphaera saccharovorans]|nr:uracil phosphoribosyltransferase [TACK group archaeon]
MTKFIDGVTVLDNPFLQKLLTELRDKNTNQESFRQQLRRIGVFMGYELCRFLETRDVEVETPMRVKAKGVDIPELKNTVLISVLRASLPMTDGLLEVFSSAKVGFVVAKRREADAGPSTIDTEIYYVNVPSTDNKLVILADPMLATGSTIKRVLPRVLEKGKPSKVVIMTLIASEYGLSAIRREFPDAQLFTAAVDPSLDQNGFIIPGLGDAGDRSFS